MFIKKLIRTKPNLQKVALILFAFFILYTPPSDPDFGWHYRYGEYIFNNQKLLTENIFSHQMLDYEWVNSYILSELIMYLPIHFFGEVYGPMILSLVLSIALSILLFHAFSKAFTSKPKLYISMFLLPLILAKYVVTVRPLFFSTIFLLILVNILLYRKKLIKFLPILFLFWANMHAGWMLGLFAFGLYYGEQVLRQKKILFNKTLLLVSLSFAAVLINPYGYKLYEQMFFKEASSIQFNISEWSPVSTGDGGITPFFVFYTISLSLIAVSTWELRKKTPLWLIGSILLFWILSFRAQYFLRVVLLF